jgi:thiamine-phosphate pyrophosphorylase
VSGRRRIGRLHVLTDESLQQRFSHAELARLAFEGGADVVQLREKRPRSIADLVPLAREMNEQAVLHGATLVVNDRVDVAEASGARAVHLGRDDLDPALARKRMGPEALIGVTANNLDEALRVGALPVDYVGVGPVFGTTSKRGPAPALGLHGLRAIVEALRLPVVAIGNITAESAGDVIRAGARAVAVLSAVVCAPDPLRETRRLREAIDEALEEIEGGDRYRD